MVLVRDFWYLVLSQSAPHYTGRLGGQMSNPSQVRVYSRVLDCGREEIRLWFLCRALNPSGSGKVTVTIEQVMASLGVGKATVYRWLKRGQGVLWRRDVRLRGHVELYLVGLRQVCKNLALGVYKNVLGAIANIPVGALASRFGVKAIATQLDAIQCQGQAWWAASQAVPESMRRFVLKPWEKISSVKSTGDNVGPKVNRQTDYYAFESDGWSIPGTTIAGIRKKTGWRCDRTIQRRLSKTYRRAHGLEPVAKMRVAEEVNNPDIMAALAQSCSGYVVDGARVYKVLKHTEHKFFALKHCIYGEEFQLFGLRRLRGKVNQVARSAWNDINTRQE